MSAIINTAMTAVAGWVKGFNERYEGTAPHVLVVGTLVCVVVGDRVVQVLRVGPADSFEYTKEVFFLYLRRYFGHLLGYTKGINDAKIGFLKEFTEKQESIEEVQEELPENSIPKAEVLALCKKHAEINMDFMKGQYSGSIYHGGMEGYTEFINEAMAMHQWSNPLHAGQFCGVRKMETEVLSMVVKMFNGTDECCGAMTSGGTESILLSMKAYRELARIEKGITKPELVVCATAHAAFDKSAHYFGLKIRHARMDPVSGKVDMKHMRSLITSNTICLVGSAYGFPHGIIDPIEEIAAIGVAKNIPVHVDACLGGFILAFAEKAGFDVEEVFDFRVPGVTSISCDTHKYGFAPKGSSTILYRTPELRRHQMHSAPNWPGGIYASPTISGSRVGNVVAGTWAAMMSHGLEGYVKSAKEIITSARFIKEELNKTPGMRVMGDPLGSVIGFASDDFDIYRLAGHLAEKGWELNSLQFPPSMHICCTRLHAINDMENSKRLIADIREGCAEFMKTKDKPATGSAALYGTTQEIPDRSIIGDVATTYFDAYYDVKGADTLRKMQEASQ
eukprot:TRINITY_DN92_c0_g2_i8.p1 TRINITY_DN92_c0_g2~~TRINITY_DN92_c0_g2_i8.p1  ORF type:complete len:563 (+),score=229.62 TRINITY_DN92_c0_g2_i8:68-1756(+)